jgi:hypothetical protein
MITKKEFFTHMSELYEEEYQDSEGYRTFKEILALRNKNQLREMKELTEMDKKHRLAYRHALAANGKELTPKQLDQYLSVIEYALDSRAE